MIALNSENNSGNSRFPAEMPAKDKKPCPHGAIENVVKNEIEVKPAANPLKPADTDAINTEFAKKKL